MPPENKFEPKLGRIRALGTKKGRKYLHQVLAAMNLAGGTAGKSKSTFHGNRIGRGAGIGRLLANRDGYGAYRQRRVVIKSRIVRLGGKGLPGARAHLRYIQRDGVTREGERGVLYGPQGEADGKAFHDRSAGDRHQFRFIVSPEDGAEYESLRPLTERLIAQMETDLGTRLDWVAVDHFNTGQPHTHIMLRGVDERGRDLVIARDYISSGMRERAAELVQLDLGPRTNLEIERRLAVEVRQERLTSLDRQLLGAADNSRRVEPRHPDHSRQTLLSGRLKTLERLGLAHEEKPGWWRLDQRLENTLRTLGERGDIIRAIHAELNRSGAGRLAGDPALFDPGAQGQRALVGRVVARGLADELGDRHYLVVEGIDGRTHYVDAGQGGELESLPRHAIVRVAARQLEERKVDRTIAEVAEANGGRYGVDLHLRHDPSASQAFAESHVRRLEAIRQAGMAVERRADGSWSIGPDYSDIAREFDRTQLTSRPVTVEILSYLPLDRLADAKGVTWLDRELASDSPEPLRDAGFGRAVRDAQQARRQWLVERGFGSLGESQFVGRTAMLELLRRNELEDFAAGLSTELGRHYRAAAEGERVEGTFRRAIDLASGRFAVIENSKEFTLVPWRQRLSGREGQWVGGIIRGGGISWSFGRQRAGPSV